MTMAAAPKIPRILDACCGGRMFWYRKDNPSALFMDCREVEKSAFANNWNPNWCVKPDVIADFRDMPFPDDTFRLVVYDPRVRQAVPSCLARGVRVWPEGPVTMDAADLRKHAFTRALRGGATLVGLIPATLAMFVSAVVCVIWIGVRAGWEVMIDDVHMVSKDPGRSP